MNKFNVGQLVTVVENSGFPQFKDPCVFEIESYREMGGITQYYLIGKAHAVKSMHKKFLESKTPIGPLPENILEETTEEYLNTILASLKPPKKEKADAEVTFNGLLSIKSYADGRISHNFNSGRLEVFITDEEQKKELESFMDECSNIGSQDERTVALIDKFVSNTSPYMILNKNNIAKGLQNLINFFIEFDFSPSIRFIDSLSLACKKDFKEAIDFINNYMELTTNPQKDAISEKLKSPEFKEILGMILLADPRQQVNKRFRIMYGSAGTGKTTKAAKLSNDVVIVCNQSMSPSDLLEDFKFKDGKPAYESSVLRYCMENGKPITLDEFNLLPFETIRFLQGLLDNKGKFTYKNETIEIKPGFEIIGTMNLTVSGVTFGLPEPLVDRAYMIEKAKLTGNDLLKAKFGTYN